MAKRKKTPARDYTPRTRVPKERPLYEGEFVDGLDPPNHMLFLDQMTEECREACGKLFSRRYIWPLTSAMRETDDVKTGVFVHEMHGEKHWSEWADHPPTWMDPHLFLNMALADERVQKILRVCYKKNDRHAWKRLLGLFQEIFDEQYMPTIMERFEEEGAPMIAQWIIRHYADQQIQKQVDEEAAKKQPSRRRRS